MITPDEMKASILRILSEVERETVSKTVDKSIADHARLESFRTRRDAPAWVDALYSAKVKVGRPKVIRVRGMYGKDMSVCEDGLYVVAQVVLEIGDRKSRVFEMKEVAGYPSSGKRFRVPPLGTNFYLGSSAEAALDRDHVTASAISALTDPLVSAVRAAVADAVARAPALVREFRAPRLKDEESVIADRLGPVLKDNPLAALPPASLALILKTPWEELERLVSFLKGSRAIAGGVTEESMEHILKLIVAQEVMRS